MGVVHNTKCECTTFGCCSESYMQNKHSFCLPGHFAWICKVGYTIDDLRIVKVIRIGFENATGFAQMRGRLDFAPVFIQFLNVIPASVNMSSGGVVFLRWGGRGTESDCWLLARRKLTYIWSSLWSASAPPSREPFNFSSQHCALLWFPFLISKTSCFVCVDLSLLERNHVRN